MVDQLLGIRGELAKVLGDATLLGGGAEDII